MNGPNNKIGWCDYTWTPKTGCEGNPESDCYQYCYARSMYERFGWSFKPEFHPERLKEPYKVKTPSRIFVCSTSDLFSKSTKPEWYNEIIKVIQDNPQHTFQLLTKCPENIPERVWFPKNVWIGVTVTNMSELYRINKLGPVYATKKFVSFEPLKSYVNILDYWKPDWLIIGQQTGPNAVKIKKEWVDKLIYDAQLVNIPIYVKDNLPWFQQLKEFP